MVEVFANIVGQGSVFDGNTRGQRDTWRVAWARAARSAAHWTGSTSALLTPHVVGMHNLVHLPAGQAMDPSPRAVGGHHDGSLWQRRRTHRDTPSAAIVPCCGAHLSAPAPARWQPLQDRQSAPIFTSSSNTRLRPGSRAVIVTRCHRRKSSRSLPRPGRSPLLHSHRLPHQERRPCRRQRRRQSARQRGTDHAPLHGLLGLVAVLWPTMPSRSSRTVSPSSVRTSSMTPSNRT